MPPAAGFADFCSMPVTAISQSSQITPFFMQRCTAFIERRPITGSFRFFCTFPPQFLCFITIFCQHLWCCSHIFLVYTDDILVLQRSQVIINTLLNAFLAKWELRWKHPTSPAVFLHLTRLSASCREQIFA